VVAGYITENLLHHHAGRAAIYRAPPLLPSLARYREGLLSYTIQREPPLSHDIERKSLLSYTIERERASSLTR
jgi:hypothetical protein